MTRASVVELRARAVHFFSRYDEDAFFEWLTKLPCVAGVEGQGDTIVIRVLKAEVDEPALRELLALFHRYRIDMRQLAAFDKRAFSNWLHKREAYWYQAVFGPSNEFLADAR